MYLECSNCKWVAKPLYGLTVSFGSAPTTFTGGALVAAIGPEVRFGT
jgi:hypothetical protein